MLAYVVPLCLLVVLAEASVPTLPYGQPWKLKNHHLKKIKNGQPVSNVVMVDFANPSPSPLTQHWERDKDAMCVITANPAYDQRQFQRRVDQAAKFGCSGIVLNLHDDYGNHQNYIPPIKNYAKYTHKKNMLMGVSQVAPATVGDWATDVDFAIVSDCATTNTCANYEIPEFYGKPILHVESHAPPAIVCGPTVPHGFVTKYSEEGVWKDCRPMSFPVARRQADCEDNCDWAAQKLTSTITKVNPMTGLVLFSSYTSKPPSDTLALEFVSSPFSGVVTAKDTYDWSYIENELTKIADRGHQGIIRFWYGSPGSPSGEPAYIKKLPGYPPMVRKNNAEGQIVEYTNWASKEIKEFNTEFYRKLAAKYDGDKRLAFIQIGFGHWSEYHIYDQKYEMGVNFPDYNYQEAFLKEAAKLFKTTPWQLSVDSVDAEFLQGAFFAKPELLKIKFGCFMDTILAGLPDTLQNTYKAMLLRYDDRAMQAPMGGEIAYDPKTQQMSLSKKGPYGESIDSAVRRDHVTYSLANDAMQSRNNNELGSLEAKIERFKEVSMGMGYRFVIQSYHVNDETEESHVVVLNTGTAPAYYDMYVAVGGKRATESLRLLQAGDKKGFYIKGAKGGPVTIESDHITSKQTIQYHASTTGKEAFSHPVPSTTVSRYAYFE